MVEYQPGQEVLYEEDGGSCVAEVVENNCRGTFQSYKLRVVSQLSRPTLPGIREGHKFTAGQELKFSLNPGFTGFAMGLGRIVGLADDPRVMGQVTRNLSDLEN